MEQHYGRRTPFRVPEGYFDGLTSQMMQQLPEPKAIPLHQAAPRGSWWSSLRPFAIAASFCAVAFGVARYLHHDQRPASTTEAGVIVASQPTYTAADEYADYAMFDTQDLYALMEDY